MKDYSITINHTVYEDTKEFETEAQAREFCATKRKAIAEHLGANWLDVWFEIYTDEEREKQLREKIAQEIESYMNNYFGDFTDAIKPHLIAIARGKKDRFV